MYGCRGGAWDAGGVPCGGRLERNGRGFGQLRLGQSRREYVLDSDRLPWRLSVCRQWLLHGLCLLRGQLRLSGFIQSKLLIEDLFLRIEARWLCWFDPFEGVGGWGLWSQFDSGRRIDGTGHGFEVIGCRDIGGSGWS